MKFITVSLHSYCCTTFRHSRHKYCLFSDWRQWT